MRKILVVDDDSSVRRALMEVLANLGVDAVAVGSVREAFQTLREFDADLVISDIAMPGEDGYALIQQIRAREPERGGQIPAAALTAYARPEDCLRALSAGFQIHLTKPLESSELAAAVAALAGRTAKA